LKFLPSQLIATDEDKARFNQEAKAASAMNHPNVCTIYSIEEDNNQLFIVMEYIDGQTLRERKQNISEKQILDIGIQVAEGLAAAHEKGIVHRDIKPENIMMRKDGIVQIMDFGLAKLFTSSNVSRLTKAGTTMGTMGYMSPEQVQGLDVDHRTDIFSLGVVLYELLAGESPFKGIHETAIMYEIVNVDPAPISTIKENFSSELDEIILECLEKDKDERYQSAKELSKDLRKVKKSTGHRKSRVYNVNSDAFKTTSTATTSVTPSGSIAIEVFNKRFELKKLVPMAFLITIITSLTFVYLYFNRHEVIETGTIQFDISSPEGTKLESETPEISPDGKTIAFTAIDSTGKSMIWLRQLESINATPLTGTENASSPFWSYDNKFLGFFANGKLNKLNISSGSIQVLCDASEGYGGTWCSSDLILFTPSFFSQIFKINANGGIATQATILDKSRGEENHFWAQFFPDNTHFIYTAFSRNEGNSGFYVGSTDDKSKIKIMSTERSDVRERVKFVSPDYLFFLKNNALMLQKFDPSDYKIQNDPQLFLSNVYDFSISDNVLVVSQNAVKYKSELIFYNRQGKQLEVKDNLGFFIEMSVSPDENNIAYHRIFSPDDNQIFNQDIWILNKQRDIASRLTFEAAADVAPVWSPDGKNIAYSSSPDSVYDIYEKSLNDNGKPKLLLKTNYSKSVLDWSLDRKYILYLSQDDLWILPMFGDYKPFQYFHSDFIEDAGAFSPDGKWIAYSSNESGRDEVYIQSFPKPKQKYTVSTNGGSHPKWRKDGKELFYLSPDNILTAADIKTEPILIIGTPKPLFKVSSIEYFNMYAAINNGNNFVVNRFLTDITHKPLRVIVNWRSLLNEK